MGAEAPYLGTKPLLGPIMIYGAHLNKNKNNQWFIILYEHNTKILYIYLGIFVQYLGMMPGLEALTWAHNDMMEPI